MIPGVSKLRQYLLFLTLFAGLMAVGKFGQTRLPAHSYFQKVTLKCHPMRRIPHHVALKGELTWEEAWFEPVKAQEEILEQLTRFHEKHNPPLRPRSGWPHLEVTAIERAPKEASGPYLVRWEAQYDVDSCKKISSSAQEYASLTAVIQKKGRSD